MKTHLLDLMELPSLQRRLIQLLLRRGMMYESELRRVVQLLPEGENLTPAQFDSMLESLESAGWMSRSTDSGDAQWRVNLTRRKPRSEAPIWERVNLESIRQQWHVRFPIAGVRTAPEPDEPDLLMRRGGKRTLSQAIWDKLEDTPVDEPKSKAVLDALDKPKDRSSSDKKDIRKKLWDALADDE